MDILLSLKPAIKQAVVIQNEIELLNEAVLKIEQKTASKNHSSKCF